MNLYQHNSYLREYNESNGTNLMPVNNKGLYYISEGLYSNKIDSLDDFKEGDTILIANSVTNRAIGLKLLEEAGLLKLNPDTEFPGLPDIVDNPLNLEIKEVDNREQYLDENNVTAIVSMGETMVRAGYDPSSAIYYASKEILEDTQQCLVVREEDQYADWALEFFDINVGPKMQQHYIDNYGEGVYIFAD